MSIHCIYKGISTYTSISANKWRFPRFLTKTTSSQEISLWIFYWQKLGRKHFLLQYYLYSVCFLYTSVFFIQCLFSLYFTTLLWNFYDIQSLSFPSFVLKGFRHKWMRLTCISFSFMRIHPREKYSTLLFTFTFITLLLKSCTNTLGLRFETTTVYKIKRQSSLGYLRNDPS